MAHLALLISFLSSSDKQLHAAGPPTFSINSSSHRSSLSISFFDFFRGGGGGRGGGGVRLLGWSGAILERKDREALAYGEYAIPGAVRRTDCALSLPAGEGVWGSELTRFISSLMGVDFVFGAMV